MILATILNKELVSTKSSINILWTETNEKFTKFIQSFGHNLITYKDLYYGNNVPQLIICNNKLNDYAQYINLSIKLHLPVLIIDHEPKNKFLDINKVGELNDFPCKHHICLSEAIKTSWGVQDCQILSYDPDNKDNKAIWQNLIFQTSKKNFLL